ncbi:hypothetical protein SBA2_560015 [Acidobacteriia bacterium SbA2]|nr:hypothetical protein SBA2_560015 [Acidobacteriia bacterium SbA2]
MVPDGPSDRAGVDLGAKAGTGQKRSCGDCQSQKERLQETTVSLHPFILLSSAAHSRGWRSTKR